MTNELIDPKLLADPADDARRPFDAGVPPDTVHRESLGDLHVGESNAVLVHKHVLHAALETDFRGQGSFGRGSARESRL